MGETPAAKSRDAHTSMQWNNLNHMLGILRTIERPKSNRLGYQYYVHLAYNHAKLTRRGDNPKKKIFIYVPYVSRNHRLIIHNHVITG